MKLYKVNFIFNEKVIFEMSPVIILPRKGEKIKYDKILYFITDVIWDINKGAYEVYIEEVLWKLEQVL